MNTYYMPKQKKDYKRIAKTEQKFARIINSFVAKEDCRSLTSFINKILTDYVKDK